MKVTLYTIPECPYCQQARDYFTAKGIQFEEKDVKADKDSLSEMLSLSNKFAGVPFCSVLKDSGETVMLKGFTEADYDVACGVGGNKEVEGMGADKLNAAPDMGMAPAAPMPSADAMNMPPLPEVSADMPVATMPAAPVMGMPAAPMPSMDPMAGLPPMPQVPAMPQVPVMPMTPPPAPAMPSALPTEPQDDLSSLLKDLESKVAQINPAPASGVAPVAPAMPGGMPDLPPVQSQS
jgi:glutaredoxin 3